MNPDFSPPLNLNMFQNGQRITPSMLNRFNYAINRQNAGVYPPRVELPDTGAVPLASPVTLVRLLSVKNLSLSGPATVDGINVEQDDLVIAQNQTDPTENGIYSANVTASTDWDNVTTDPLSTLVFVNDGSVYYDTLWGIFDPDNNDWEAVNAIVRRFKISALGISSADALGCNPYKADGTVDSSISVTIAKPYLVQDIAAWNGLTFTYSNTQTRVATRTSDHQTENQVVVPAYVAGDDIWAVRSVLDTGVPNTDWMDLNLDARQWAKSAS